MTTSTLPYIPDHAPFTGEQRAWLNGFLAGMYSSAPQTAAAAAPEPASLHLSLYFASQSGTAERLAKKMAKELKARGHTTEIASLATVTPDLLAQQKHALIFASTYGEGDPPETATTFRDAIFRDPAPALTGLRFSVFALGDRNYEHFCRFGVELDQRLAALGATRLLTVLESDVDVDTPFAEWQQNLWPTLLATPAAKAAPVASLPVVAPAHAAPAPAVQLHGRDNPYLAELIERRPLTAAGSSKQTLHLSFSLADSVVHYEPGDACAVTAQNDAALVDEILSVSAFDPSTQVTVSKAGNVTLRDALLDHVQPTRLTRKIVEHIARKSGARILEALLPVEQGAHLETYMYGRGLVDLLDEYPGVLESAQELIDILPRLSPRLYSISSSPRAHGAEVHCTIAVVRYRSHNRERGGVASTMLADRTGVNQRVPIYIQQNSRFRLPAAETPMIMIGPGTGIAPFRSFLHERRALGHTGRNWLFFGDRRADTDFLYREELQQMTSDGHLTRLDTAFSRDQEQKIYVQDRMLEHGAELFRWLSDGAQIYVCGDASRMAKDVDASLHKLIATHANLDADAAAEYVTQLHEDRRYHRDVY